MLSVQLEQLLFTVAQHLRGHAQGDAAALAAALESALADSMASKVSHAQAQRRRALRGRGGRPARVYVMEVTPGYVQAFKGVAAAHAALTAELGKYGTRGIPHANSMAVSMSRSGQWFRTVETPDGTVSVTLRKATEEETARYLAQESGTEIASEKKPSKERAKP